jgi:hypothetical protein
MEVPSMKRVLFVLFTFLAVMAAVGLTLAFTRPLKWAEGIGSPDWRRALGETVEHVVDQVIEEAAA